MAALRLADERLSAFDGPGSILVLSNSAPDNLEQQPKENITSIAYTPGSVNDFSSQGIRGIDWQPDNSHLTSALAQARRNATWPTELNDGQVPKRDDSWLLLVPLLALAGLWFRPGWFVRWRGA